MFCSREKHAVAYGNINKYLKSNSFQRLLIASITILIAFVIVENGAIPKKYRLNKGDKSQYDITAPRDIENKLKSAQNARAAADAVPPVMIEINTASIDVLNNLDDFFTMVEDARKGVDKSLQAQGVDKSSKNYSQRLSAAQASAVKKLKDKIKELNVPISDEQLRYIISKTSDDSMAGFKKITKDIVSNSMKKDITSDNLAVNIDTAQNDIQNSELNQDLKNIGVLLVRTLIIPNRTVNNEKTKENKDKEYLNPRNREIITEGSRIISVGDIVTKDKLKVLADLNLLETTSRFDFLFSAGIFVLLILLAAFLILYMNHFCKSILYNKCDIILLSVVILLTLLVARVISEYFSPLAIPIFMATMLISILLDLNLACIVNIILSVIILLITKEDMKFFYMAITSGVFSAFLVSKINQRSKLSMAGVFIGLINVLIIVSIGIIKKSDITSITNESMIVFLNGIISIILTIGMLPFLESVFNLVTPLKLLELTNPNQTLLKRMLMEAPGTYHHSLMVGNLSEVATEAIGGNALLARVGAHFHDIGKLKRPGFFKENQFSDNPHDRMTANLSTLVITSHTHDGVELAIKHKIPLAIRDIISQHHGTTLVAYFYHKAKKGEKGEMIKPENFRYEGPQPTTKESAVVMLADSVEAAVRSMADKTEGRIEGLVRKIIRDKLNDGQLDLCNLTLKNLDDIANGFMRVLSGFFHEREEYPDIKIKAADIDRIEIVDPMDETIKEQQNDKQLTEEEKETYDTFG